MKTQLTKVLIVCLMAIALHGFGTDEHVFKSQNAEITVINTDASKGTPADSVPNLSEACDICEVVHQYVSLDQSSLIPVPPPATLGMRSILVPSGRKPGGIARPPTI
ncbi:MAG: hypothetical protein COA85_12300 [Robiginitomaculum sp.]|nr:MAG: hypothetical protein COB24_11270 [Hyphomicrobiales bacterium]PHS21927.1 MAG: hypothetical protein COA85_12300 [Robiginitomaculum sp.]